MKRALRVACLAVRMAGAAGGQPPDAGEATNLPAGFLLADLPDGASVRRRLDALDAAPR